MDTDALQQLLEEYGLYRKRQMAFPTRERQLDALSLQLDCAGCGGERTFRRCGPNGRTLFRPAHTAPLAALPQDVSPGDVIMLNFACVACHSTTYAFALSVGPESSSAQKVGQWPAQEVKIPKVVARVLGGHTDLYKSGLLLEREGFGVGAFAYYRRIVEATIDGLLDKIEAILPEDERSDYSGRLMEVKKQHTAEKRLEAVSGLLPSHLRPNDVNPLSAIYSALSQGIHSDSEETCLDYAEAIRTSLVYLIEEIDRHKAQQATFSDRIKKVLAKPKK